MICLNLCTAIMYFCCLPLCVCVITHLIRSVGLFFFFFSLQMNTFICIYIQKGKAECVLAICSRSLQQ